MPGEIAIYLLGAQGGVAADFARLYEATTPTLLRYLRVTADGDHAQLARTTWTTVLPQLQACPPDEDAWMELVLAAARSAVAVSAVTAADGAASVAPAGTTVATAEVVADPLDRAVAALRTCPPAEAEVLAMGLVANLGREAVSRLTGLEPSAVLALVLRGQHHLTLSLEALIDALRVPGTPAELADLPFAAGLFASTAPLPFTRAATPSQASTPVATSATPPPAAKTGVPVAGLPAASVVDIHSLQSSAPANAAGNARAAPSRSVRVGAGAVAWLLAVGGVGTAAAMSGLLSVAMHGILGGPDTPPLVTAEGPRTPGTSSPPTPAPSTGRTPTSTPTAVANPAPTTVATPSDTGAGQGDVQPVSQPGQGEVQVVVASFVPGPSTPSTAVGTPPPAPTPTPTGPTQPTTPSPSSPGLPRGPRSPVPATPTVNGNANGRDPGADNGQVNGQGNGQGNGRGRPTSNASAHRVVVHPNASRASHGTQGTQGKQGKAHAKVQAKGHATVHGTVHGKGSSPSQGRQRA